MSDLSSAATLTLKIDTGGAKQELGELRGAYEALKKELASGLRAVGGSSELIQQLKTSQAEVQALQNKITEFKGKSSQLWISYVAEMEQGRVGAKKALEGMTSDQVIELSKQQKLDKQRASDLLKAHTEALSMDRSFNTERSRIAEIQQKRDIEQHREALAERNRISEIQQKRDIEQHREALAERSRITDLQQKRDIEQYRQGQAELQRLKDIQERRDVENLNERVARESAAAAWASKSRMEQLRAALPASRAISAGADAGLVHSAGAVSLAGQMGSTSAIEAEISKLAAANSRLSGSTGQAAASQLHWNAAANEAHALARGLSGSLGTLWMTYGAIAPLLVGAALGGAFVQASKAGAEFAYQLAFVKALGGETAESIGSIGRAALALSGESLYGPVDLANGLRILSQAGLSAADSMKALPQATALATVGEMNMEQAAVTLTGVMNAFDLGVGDMAHIGDVFAKSAAMSQTSVEGMTESMKTASVVGEQYGTSMEDTATALTLLAKVNITGTAAGTAFRNMVKELYAPVPQAAAAFEKLGLKTKDAIGNLRPFSDIIYDLKGRLQDFDKAGQVQILQRMFGERGAKEAIAMLSKTREEWDKLKATISNSDGFMDDVTKQLEDTTKGQWKQAINTLQVDLIKAFQDAEPTLRNVATLLKDMFSSDEFKQGLTRAVEGMGALANMLLKVGPTLLAVAEMWLVYKSAMIGAALWSAAATGVTGLQAAMMGLSGVMGPGLSMMAATKGTLGGLVAALGVIPSPLTVVAGLLSGGAIAWALWGDSASRAGDKAYDSAKRAEEALSRLNRTKKYGVGDVGAAREELDKAETTLSLRVQGRVAGTGLSDARDAVTKWQDIVNQLEAEESKRAPAVSKESKKGSRDVTEILGAGKKGVGGMSSYAVEKDALASALQRIKEQTKGFVTDLEDSYNQGLMRTEDFITRKEKMEIESIDKQRATVKAELDLTKDGNLRKKLGNDLLELEAQRVTTASAARRDLNKSYFEERKLRAELSQASTDAEAQAKFEIELIGKTTIEQEKLTIARKADLDLRNRTRNADGSFKAGVSAEGEALLREETEKNSRRDQDTAQGRYDANRTFEAGWAKSFAAYREDATNSAKIASDAFQQGTSIMEGAITQFTTTGKLAYKDMAKQIIQYIGQIAAKQAAAGLMNLVGSVAMSYFGGGGSSAGGSIGASTATGIGGQSVSLTSGAYGLGGQSVSLNANALGGVYSSPSLSAYSNGVYSTPKTFAFANGGVFAEAGPEAIMPLARDSAGRLGVRTQDGGGSGNVTIEVNVNVDNSGATTQDTKTDGNGSAKQLGEVMANAARKVIIEEMRSGGILSNVRA